LCTGQCCQSAGFCLKMFAWAVGAVSARFGEQHLELCVNVRF
jgi:hypothetical protein